MTTRASLRFGEAISWAERAVWSMRSSGFDPQGSKTRPARRAASVMQPQASVAELIAKALAGDAAALDWLFACCREYLALIARTRVETWLRAKVDASDLVQQTMMEAYRGFDRFHGGSEGEWLAWLRGILDHNAADFVRHYQSQKRKA